MYTLVNYLYYLMLMLKKYIEISEKYTKMNITK